MANGRCRMHGGKNPGAPKGNRNAYRHGRYTAIAERRALNARAAALLIEAIRARIDIGRKLRRGLLRPKEAEKQHEAIRAKIADAFAIRKEAVALKYAWLDRNHCRRED